MFFNHFLKRTGIDNDFPNCLYMGFMCPVGNTVLLKIDVIQHTDTLVQHLSCLQGFQRNLEYCSIFSPFATTNKSLTFLCSSLTVFSISFELIRQVKWRFLSETVVLGLHLYACKQLGDIGIHPQIKKNIFKLTEI